MKKKLFAILLSGLSLTCTIVSCQKGAFDDAYYNPETSVRGDIPRLFSGLLFNQDKASSNTIMPRYWNLYVFQLPTLGTYSQLFGYTGSQGRYEQPSNYTQSRWQYFYTANIASYIDVLKHYDALETQDDKDGYNLFVQASKVFLYDQASQMIDMWGDIPFSEAGRTITTGGEILNAKYDDQQELYIKFIEDLKVIADYLDGYQANVFYKQMFDKADILNKGNIQKWKIYANSLRLRLAMRISYANEAKAREVVTEILNNPTKYPVVSEISNSIKIDASTAELRSVVGVDGIKNSFESSGFNYAPGFIINNLMKPSNDPRLPVLFSKNIEGNYVGLDPNLDQQTQDNLISGRLISRVDTATFSRNDKFPGIIITPAEVSFLKAEANERWGIGASAQTEYEKGIRQSIDFWYYVNALNDNADGTAFVPKVKPDDATVNTFLTNAVVAYTGTKEQKLEKIATQNWANFTVIQAQHAWAEQRRTGYPNLVFSNDSSSPQSPQPPKRLLYPENERTYNPINYEAVKAKDRVDVKIFWHVK
jgi:hypothetical protein